MLKTPKALRLQIGVFGRTNVGKSSFLNVIAGQDVAITSPVAGTTTDVVEKTMELLPLGPVVILDTAGLDDSSELAEARIAKTRRVFDRADVAVIVTIPAVWGEFEEAIAAEAESRKIPVIAVINKCDMETPTDDFLAGVQKRISRVVTGCAIDPGSAEPFRNAFKQALISQVPEDLLAQPAIVGDLLPAGGLAILVVPIDLQAPKGRLILPQVQTIRDALDNDAATLVVKEREYAAMLEKLKTPPDLVVCDSQVVARVVAETPRDVKVTTFSILFSRFKGDLNELAKGAARIDHLRPGDKVLISEACSHHALEDDIGRVKIPRWLRQYTGCALEIDHIAGHDYPENLHEYKLIIHCGACMINRRAMLSRLSLADAQQVAITNYGVCISLLQGVLERALEPFPEAMEAFRSASQPTGQSIHR